MVYDCYLPDQFSITCLCVRLYFIQRDMGENVCMKAFGIKVFMSQRTCLNVWFIIIISSDVLYKNIKR